MTLEFMLGPREARTRVLTTASARSKWNIATNTTLCFTAAHPLDGIGPSISMSALSGAAKPRARKPRSKPPND
jgi:hypothetical protein